MADHRYIKTPTQSDSLFLENLLHSLSTCLKGYDNILLLGDFNMTPKHRNLQHFVDPFNLENLKHEATCFKGLPSCIDLIIINRKPYSTLCDSNWNVRFSQISSSQFKISSTERSRQA